MWKSFLFFSSTKFCWENNKIWEIFEIYVFLLYISLLFLKFGRKKIQIFEISNLSKNDNPWWRPRGQTWGKGSMILFHGFNSQVKDQNPKSMWHVTCDLCTRVCLEWKFWVFFHLHSISPLKRTNNVDTAKQYSHKNPMYLNLCCEWTYYFRYSTM